MNDTEASHNCTIDIFFINNKLTQQDVIDNIKLLHLCLKAQYQIRGMSIENKSLTMRGYLDNRGWLTVKIIFIKLFDSIYDVITSFDLPNRGFAYRKGSKLYYTESALDYYRTKIIYYFNENKMEKYSKRSYNTIQPIKKCLHDCKNSIDYTNRNLIILMIYLNILHYNLIKYA